MTRLLALTRREILAYFYRPVPYLVMFLFLLMTAWIFWGSMQMGEAPITYVPVLQWLAFALLFLMPLLTMNSVAEERASNTLETLLTAPVADWQVIAAKWSATFTFYVCMLLPTLVYWPILSHFAAEASLVGKPDVGPIVAGYVGAMLIGGMYIAIGIFASSVTENSLLSAFLAFFAAIGLLIVNMFAGDPGSASVFWESAGGYLAPDRHYAEFLKGRIALYDVVYFASFILFFLFLAVRSLESRKWR